MPYSKTKFTIFNFKNENQNKLLENSLAKEQDVIKSRHN